MWNEAWDDMPILAIDTETTGFHNHDRIVELGMVLLVGDGVVDTYQTYVDPGFPIPAEATNVHKITDRMVRNAPRFPDIVGQVVEFLCRGAPWVAHNAPFDMRMLSYDLPPGHWPRGIPTLCTLEKAKSRKIRRKRLCDLALQYDIPQTEAHTAVDDALVCARLARRFTKGFRVLDYFTKMSEEWIS